MIKNSFGNYVVQKALQVAEGEKGKKLLLAIKNNIEFVYDRKIIKKWRTILSNVDNEYGSDYHNKISFKNY